MKSKYFITSLFLSSFSFTQAVQPAKPNILFIVGDDMGYGDVGFHKCKDIPTPNLDALAASGVRFWIRNGCSGKTSQKKYARQ